ncbi:hypothetical protein K7432_013300 [Basidiobolus ranarum]|uniref:Uncharacterized protein n=1 Tax=Basidiobolus ranarum TaxID=34480 RepID=A0ABR2WJF5_9FUNG
MFDLSKLSQDPALFSESIETPNILASNYPEDFGTTPTVYSGLGSLGLDLSTQIDLLQQQSFNTSYVNKKKTPNTTDEFNWTDCNMPLDATKMNAMKNRANTKSRSKSFQHQEDVDSDSAACPWNRLSRSNSSDFQLKQPPLKKRRHTTSMLEFY